MSNRNSEQEIVAAETAQEQAPMIDPGEELVDFYAPVIDPERDMPLFLGVNGENVRVMRGEQVRIKRKFAEVYQHSVELERERQRAYAKLRKDSAKALAEL